jgi:hypothetical protein
MLVHHDLSVWNADPIDEVLVGSQNRRACLAATNLEANYGRDRF